MFTRPLKVPDRSFFLFGPRGSGKTTWICDKFPDAPRFDLLRADEHLRLQRDPGSFGEACEAFAEGSWIVVDEVQRVPAVLDEVQRLMTARRQKFVLSGSSARKLRRGGANLLAGRAEVRHLFPFTNHELGYGRSLDDALAYGMLPLAVESPEPRRFLKAYVETYLHEEVQAEALVRQIGGFVRFLEVAARVNGQLVNVSGIARDAQVARPTVQDYFQILVDTLLAAWLPAWRSKKTVRQVMHPKLYLFDCGVIRHLAGYGHLHVHPEERGFLFETYLLHEIRAFLEYTALDYPVFYWRTHDGAEVDFLVETAKGVVLIEVKSGARWDRGFLAGMSRFRSVHPKLKTKSLGVFTGSRALVVDGVRVLPWLTFLKELWGGELIA